MVNGQNFLNNQNVTTFFFNSGRNTSLAKNGLSRTNFNGRTSINSTSVKMLKFSCKFNHYLLSRDYYSKF